MEVDSNRDGRGKASAGGGGPAEWLMHLKTAMFGSLHVIQKKVSSITNRVACVLKCT